METVLYEEEIDVSDLSNDDREFFLELLPCEWTLAEKEDNRLVVIANPTER